MAAENGFLSGVKVEQFIKSNNEQIKQALGDSKTTLSKGFKSLLTVQQASLKSMDSLNRQVKDLNKKMSERDRKSDTILKKIGDAKKSLTFDNFKKLFEKNKDKKPKIESKPKDFFKRKDYGKEQTSQLMMTNTLLGALLNQGKKKEKGGFLSGLLGMLGKGLLLSGLLAVGGLVGFILTGKKEFLSSVVKGVYRFVRVLALIPKVLSSIPKIISTIGKAINGIAKSSKFLITAPKIFKSIATSIKSIGVLKTAKNAITGTKVVGNIAKGIGVAKDSVKAVGVGKTLLAGGKAALGVGGKALAGAAGKAVLKTGAKFALKQLFHPVISLVSAVARFSKGDWVGGFMELGSGGLWLLNLVAPGVGSALSMVMDIAILGRDLKNAKGVGKDLGKTPKSPKPVPKNQKGDAYSMRKKSTKLARKSVPFAEQMMQTDYKVDNATKGYNSMFNSLSSKPSNAFFYMTPDMNNAVANPDTSGSPFYIANGYNVNLSGMNTGVWSNFVGMANDYYNTTGKRIPITDAKRSYEEQAMLYKKYHGIKPVAKPGRSMHEFGFAMDINSTEGNDLAQRGLLDKWGFSRPVGGEAWHIEPKGFAKHYASVREGKFGWKQYSEDGGMQQRGDGSTIVPKPVSSSSVPKFTPKPVNDKNNLPLTNNIEKVNKSDAPIKVSLSDSDLEKLAMLFGKQISENTPKSANKMGTINVGTPRQNL